MALKHRCFKLKPIPCLYESRLLRFQTDRRCHQVCLSSRQCLLFCTAIANKSGDGLVHRLDLLDVERRHFAMQGACFAFDISNALCFCLGHVLKLMNAGREAPMPSSQYHRGRLGYPRLACWLPIQTAAVSDNVLAKLHFVVDKCQELVQNGCDVSRGSLVLVLHRSLAAGEGPECGFVGRHFRREGGNIGCRRRHDRIVSKITLK